jgi:hypothetical protein
MSSKDSDLADREAREEWIDRNLREARAGTNRIRSQADTPPPDKLERDTPNTYPGGRS